jgi:hypothetical protein
MMAIAAILLATGLAAGLSTGLYEQALSKLLAQRYPDAEYLLLDARDGRGIIRHWREPAEPVPVGSLWKPLLLASSGGRREFECRPGMCWLAQGHGRMDAVDALAHSCNAWFLDHAAHLPLPVVAAAAARFALPPPPDSEPRTLIGLGEDWKVAPAAIARAYLGFVQNPEVRRGMGRSAAAGTSKHISIDALAKTGTASCSHAARGPGDGLVIALWPKDQPRYLLLLRLHGTTGAVAARTAGAMLRCIRDGR